MADIYRKNKYENVAGEEELREMIKVVPSSFKAILVGVAILIVISFLWLGFGWKGKTISISGIYHPGAVGEGEIICFPNVTNGKQMAEGMKVSIYINGYDQSQYGYLTGVITYVEPYITSEETMMDLLKEQSVVDVFTSSAPCVQVVCKLDEDIASANGYVCSNSKGESIQLSDGMFVSASVMISEEHPLVEDIFR